LSSPDLPSDYGEAEAIVETIRGVIKCHIVAGPSGEIVEVHVTATGRHPRQVVRDVESALATTLRKKIDHKRISVAIVEKRDPSAPAPVPLHPINGGPSAPRAPRRPAPGREAGLDEEESEREPSPAERRASARLRYVGLNVNVTGSGCNASVRLLRGNVPMLGDSSTPAGGQSALRSIAEATLRAVIACYETAPPFTIDEIAFLTISQRQVVIVAVGCHAGRETTHLVGSTFVGHDPQQAVILATLDAVNRYSGRLKEREITEYEVGPAPASS
jgi:hypothetical protein